MKKSFKKLPQSLLICTTVLYCMLAFDALKAEPQQMQATPSVTALPTLINKSSPETELIESGPGEDEKDEPNIYLTFDNASLLSVVNSFAEQANISQIFTKDVAPALESAKVTITTRTPLTLKRAWNVLLTLLEMNDFSIIKVDGIHRVVKTSDNGKEPLPVYSSGTGTEPEDLPNSSKIIRYIYFFKTLSYNVASSILGNMLAPDSIKANKDLNCCIIKEQSINIKSAMRILKELDDNGLREAIKILRLNYADAKTIETLFINDIFQKDKENKSAINFAAPAQQERTYFSSTTRIYADTAHNQLILMGTEEHLNKIIEFIGKYLDVPHDDAMSRLYIYELRYQEATTIKNLLTKILAAPKSVDPKTSIVGEYKYFEDVIIAAEEAKKSDNTDKKNFSQGGGNRLIISCNKDDRKRIKDLIKQLDTPQPQIAIEVLFIGIENGLTKTLGAQTFGFKGKTNMGLGTSTAEFMNLGILPNNGDNINPGQNYGPKNYTNLALTPDKNPLKSTTFNYTSPYTQAGSSFMTLGRPGSATDPVDPKTGRPIGENIWSIINATYNMANSHIISQPYIITANNRPCTVSRTDELVITGKLEGTAASQVIVKREKITASLSVDILPRINRDGVVDIDVTVNNSDIQKNTDNADKSIVLTRKLITHCTLLSGEVLVLGGFTKDNVSETTYETPLLGKLPIIGNLFKTKNTKNAVSNLYIFIRPSIIKPRFEGGADEYTQLKLDYAKYQMMKNDSYAAENDPIQRWFFKPAAQTAEQAFADRADGVFRPIDDFAYSKSCPKTVKIDEDPYYRVSERIASVAAERERKKDKKKKQSQAITIPLD